VVITQSLDSSTELALITPPGDGQKRGQVRKFIAKGITMRLCVRGQRCASRGTNFYPKDPQLANFRFSETISKAASRPVPRRKSLETGAAIEGATDGRCQDRFDGDVTGLRESAYRNDIVDYPTPRGWEATQASVVKLCTARGLAAQYHHGNVGSPLAAPRYVTGSRK
jgi:hypothetical protein